jgi:Subtilase family
MPSRLLLALGAGLALIAPLRGQAPPRPVPTSELDLIFTAGRAAFHREVTSRLATSPFRSELDQTERDQLGGGLPDLYDRVIFLGWQRDQPACDSLIRVGAHDELRRRFLALSREYGDRLVDHLFVQSHDYDLLMTIPGRAGKRPLELLLPTLGYGAKRGDPGLPVNHLAPVDRSLFARQWWLGTIGLSEAQRVTTGRGVRTAVLDTGIDPTLDLFQGHLEPGLDLFGHTGPPWTGEPSWPWDWGGHGTAVTSVLLTVAPDAIVIPIRTGDGAVANDPPYPYWLIESLAAGIYAAVHRGARVINISAGIDSAAVLREAIDYAADRGVPVVAAAGRYGRTQQVGDPFTPFYPASYPETISAGAFGITKGLLTVWEPLHPSEQLDVLAPGVDVLIAQPSYPDPGPPQAVTGTSLSAPIVTGVVALMAAADSATPDSERRSRTWTGWVERVLQRTARPRLVGEAGFSERAGYGVLDAAAAVRAARRGVR